MHGRNAPHRAARSLALALAVVLGPAAAWAQQPAPHAPADAGHTAPADAGRSPAEEARRATVIARVNSTAVTVGEFEDILNEAPAPIRVTYTDPARRREVLENLIQTMLLADEARRRGLDQDPQVSTAIRRLLGQRVEQVEILQAVTPEGLPESEVSAYYAAHVGDYQQPEYRRATVIVTNDRDAAERALADLRRTRGDMRRVRELVHQYSVDEDTRAHEGDAFYFQRNGAPSGDPRGLRAGDAGVGVTGLVRGIDPHLAEALFTLVREMEPTPEPVPVAGGHFAVAMLTGIRPPIHRTLDDPGVVASIRGFITRARREQREVEMLQAIRARVHPEVHEDLLEQIHLPPSDLGNMPGFTR